MLVYALARSGDRAGSKAELERLAALSRPHPLVGALRAYLNRPGSSVDPNALPDASTKPSAGKPPTSPGLAPREPKEPHERPAPPEPREPKAPPEEHVVPGSPVDTSDLPGVKVPPSRRRRRRPRLRRPPLLRTRRRPRRRRPASTPRISPVSSEAHPASSLRLRGGDGSRRRRLRGSCATRGSLALGDRRGGEPVRRRRRSQLVGRARAGRDRPRARRSRRGARRRSSAPAPHRSHVDLVRTLRALAPSSGESGKAPAKGVFVRLGTAQLGLARAEEIGLLLGEIRKQEPVVCHADEYTNASIMLAAQGCSRVWVSPAGGVESVGHRRAAPLCQPAPGAPPHRRRLPSGRQIQGRAGALHPQRPQPGGARVARRHAAGAAHRVARARRRGAGQAQRRRRRRRRPLQPRRTRWRAA